MNLRTARTVLVASAAVVLCSVPAIAQQRYNPSANSGYNGTWSPTSQAAAARNGYGIGQNPYLNQPGYGYYGANPYAQGYPAYNGYGYGAGGVTYGAPVPSAGGYFQFGNAARGGFYWKSPSGYYYPWGGVNYGAPAPVIVVQQGESKPTQPPIADMFKDIRTYLDEQNGKGKFLPEDYAHLSRRLRDIMQKDSTFASRNGGTLDQVDEDSIRQDLTMLSGDIARRVKP